MLTKYFFVSATLSTLLILLVCIACSKSLPKYTYTAQPDSAYISGAAVRRDLMIAETVKSGIIIHLIGGHEVPSPLGTAGSFGLLTLENLSSSTAVQPVALAPGTHKIGITIFGGGRRAESEFLLETKPGERYAIKQKVIFEQGIVELPSIVSYWVENSQGKPVTEMQTVTREQMDIPRIVVVTPVYR